MDDGDEGQRRWCRGVGNVNGGMQMKRWQRDDGDGGWEFRGSGFRGLGRDRVRRREKVKGRGVKRRSHARVTRLGWGRKLDRFGSKDGLLDRVSASLSWFFSLDRFFLSI